MSNLRKKVTHHCTSNTNGMGLGRRKGGNLVFLNTKYQYFIYRDHTNIKGNTRVKKKKKVPTEEIY